ncbi:MAG: carboxypeptidase regulatory-like domain-containing protein [Vicinamibacterales bacterium]
MHYTWSKRASSLVIVAMLLGAGTMVYAQGTATSTLAGTVTDATGAVVPGADISARHVTTGTLFTAVSGANGAFTIPAVPTGTYTVTVSLQGFKTVVLNDVAVTVAGPATVKAVLEPGELAETVLVTGATEILQTQTSAIANTITSTQITRLPISRAAFDVVVQLPGVATATTTRYSSVMGLPQSTVNITLDGMNIQDNYLKTTDGMFTRVSPRIDAVEEVTVGTAGQGADTAGQGAVQVRFVTRSGTNQYIGSGYYYFQRDWMNTNTWFNLNRNFQPKPEVALYQPGGRLGGPITIPGVFQGRDKAFFFVNYEVSYSPGTYTLNRTIMNPASEKGLFRYSGGEVDLLALAASRGFESTIDPTVAKVISAIRSATAQKGTVFDRDLQTQTYTWQFPTKGVTYYPTLRLDYNLTANHRLTASGTRNHLISDPDTLNSYYRNFPGFATHGKQDSYRYSGQVSLRSILSRNLVNEARFGATGGATYFNPELNASMFAGQTPDMNGYAIALSAFRSVNNPYSASANSSREAYTKVAEDTLNWLKGSHSMSMGASFTQANVWYKQQQHVPTISFGIVQGDPADSMFNTTNFPGASSTELGYARSLYAVLTGRVSSIGRNARIAEDGTTYVILGPSMQRGRIRQIGLFAQDSWRVKPSLTVNAGLRYDVQFPFVALNNSYSTATLADVFGITGPGTGLVPGSTVTNLGNLFKPGVLEGAPPTYKMLEKGKHGYNVDWDNFSPSIGAAWTTGAQSGWLRRIFGAHGDSVFRAGFNIAYQRGGMSDFTGTYGNNPGVSIDVTRSVTNGNLGTPPVLLRASDLGPPAISLRREYPMRVPSASSDIYTFDPDVEVPWASSFSVGWQRALSRSMALEARYVHTASTGTWRLFDYNEVNIVENGFLDEFRVAQANLLANIEAGRGNTFAYTGAPGTRPLPTLLAWLNGRDRAQSGDPSSYTGNAWTNSTYVGYLYSMNANPYDFATSLRSNANYRDNAAKAGLPANFFVVNPDVDNAYVRANGFDTRYNGLQLILTRRFSQGLQLQANYSYGKGYQYDFYSFRRPAVETLSNYSNSTDNSTGGVRHVFFANWLYELPFGQGKRFGSGVGRNLDRLIGNWTFSGVIRLQSGRQFDLGNVRLFGMTPDEVRDMLEIRKTKDPANPYRTLVFNWPADVIENTIKAFSYDAKGYTQGQPTGRYFAPANSPACIETVEGYGDCGVRSLIVTGPPIARVDMTLGKQIPVRGRVNLEFQVQVYNVFNRVNFTPVAGQSSSGVFNVTRSGYEVTGAIDQSRTMQLAFRINF